MIASKSPVIVHIVLFMFIKIDPKTTHKMLYFECHISMGNGMLCQKERYPLLLKCFIPFLRYTRKVGSLLDSIYKPIVVHAMSFLPRSTLKLQSKCQIWGTLSSQGVGCFAARRYTYPLLLKCFVPFLICIKNMEETPVSICNSLIDYIALFLSMLTLKLHTKCQI